MSIVADLWEGYESLTQPQKRVVFEMYWRGYTEEEAAETMGVSQQAIHSTLVRAEKKLREKIESRLFSRPRQPFIEMTETQGATRGNGQLPDKNKAPDRSGPPASACPPPDIYLGSPARDGFIKELSWIAASPFLQLQGRGGYNRRAKENRERIARDRERERAERMAAVAA